MKKYIIFIFLSVILGEWSSMYAQTADGGIFGSGNTLIVKFKPSADITGGFTGGNFGSTLLSVKYLKIKACLVINLSSMKFMEY